jgi:hypothetical protein
VAWRLDPTKVRALVQAMPSFLRDSVLVGILLYAGEKRGS